MKVWPLKKASQHRSLRRERGRQKLHHQHVARLRPRTHRALIINRLRQVKINGEAFAFWDTIGLNEGEDGSFQDMLAVASLYHLLRHLENGVSLLVFCMRSPRITEAGKKNWRLFGDIVCQTVLAVTHLEQEDTDKWWSENEPSFRCYELNPSEIIFRTFELQEQQQGEYFHSDVGVACTTATKGKLRSGEYMFEEEYKVSCLKLRKLVFEAHIDDPWKVERVQWFQEVVRNFRHGWFCPQDVEQREYVAGQGTLDLMKRWGLQNEDEAIRIARLLEGEQT